MRKPAAVTCILLLIAPALSICGCNDASQPASSVTANKDVEKSPTPPPAGAESEKTLLDVKVGDIKVALVSFEELKQRIASFKDRVVVVDAWSTSCLPCMKEFPHLVELARRWPEDVVCISVNLDFAGLPDTAPQDCLPAVTKFLQSKGADPANLVNLVSTDTDEQMFGKFEIESIPSIFVYDRAGGLAGKLTVDTAGEDGLTYAGDVLPLVEKLIEK